MSKVEEYVEAINIREKAIKKIKSIGKSAFAEAISPVFDKFPKLEQIRFNLWWPSFNDGDATYQCSSIDECSFNGYESDDYIDEDANEAVKADYDEDMFTKNEIESIQSWLSKNVFKIFSEEDLGLIFGTDKTVDILKNNVSKVSIKTEGYCRGY